MATSKDFEKLWKQYQDEVQSSGKSIVTFCQENGIVYAQFERWYKKRGSSQDRQPVLVPVEVTGLPKESEAPKQDSPRYLVEGVTDMRLGSMFFSSEKGVKNAMIFHTIIETCKQAGIMVKDYLTYVLSELNRGNKDYASLTPSKVVLK